MFCVDGQARKFEDNPPGEATIATISADAADGSTNSGRAYRCVRFRHHRRYKGTISWKASSIGSFCTWVRPPFLKYSKGKRISFVLPAGGDHEPQPREFAFCKRGSGAQFTANMSRSAIPAPSVLSSLSCVNSNTDPLACNSPPQPCPQRFPMITTRCRPILGTAKNRSTN